MSSIIATSVSIGFLQAILAPHLRQFNLSPVVLGIMFVINGGTYALTTPAWGWFCDRYAIPKVNQNPSQHFFVQILHVSSFSFQIATVAGCMLVMIAFCIIGPAPFIPCDSILWLTILGLVIHGLGISAQLVASFSDALNIAM